MLKAHLIAGISVAQEHILKKNIFLTLSAKQISTTGISKLSRENSVSSSAKPQFLAALSTSSVKLSSSHEHSTSSIPNYLNVVRLLHLQCIWLL